MSTVTGPSVPPVATKSREYTLSELGKYKQLTAINGKVYDLSFFKHPGGPFTINAVRGKDGTKDFMEKHGKKTGEKNLKSKGITMVGVLVKG